MFDGIESVRNHTYSGYFYGCLRHWPSRGDIVISRTKTWNLRAKFPSARIHVCFDKPFYVCTHVYVCLITNEANGEKKWTVTKRSRLVEIEIDRYLSSGGKKKKNVEIRNNCYYYINWIIFVFLFFEIKA